MSTTNCSFGEFKSSIILILLAISVLISCDGQQSTTTQVEPHDLGSQMVKYTKQGRYDDAVELALKSVENSSDDEFIYQQIANVYLIRAQKDVAQRSTWVGKAVSFVDKALSVNDAKKDVAGVHVFQAARTLEFAGDMSTEEQCSYYDRARKLLIDRSPLLEGEKVTVQGKSFPLGRLRTENDRTIEEIRKKSATAGCK